MDKEKKKKKKGKQKVKTDSIINDGDLLTEYTKKFDIEGVKKIVLSPIAQRVIGCVVGENVTTEDPWMFVRKEKIQDNIELHEDSSEFLPIKECIHHYPEEEVLLGYDGSEGEGNERFFFCSDIESKNNVLQILEDHKGELQERLKNSVIKTPGIWTSCGSENEVEDSLLKNFRPLYEIELETKYPLYSGKCKFSFCFSQNKIDGYVELLPGRFPSTNIFKKRIHNSIQVTNTTVTREMQTKALYPKNVHCQYAYEYEEPKLTPERIQKLNEFLKNSTNTLLDSIFENENINIHTNDYTKIYKVSFRGIKITCRDLISFRDVISCKNKKVSCVTLNPLASGYLAVSYCRFPANYFHTKPVTNLDVVNDTAFGKHLVLLWCNVNVLTPKLELHSFREVNVVSYCPYYKNLIIGGCTNGQIAIWDLESKLKEVDVREILTANERKHREILVDMMQWTKAISQPNTKILLPTATSLLDYGHRDAITSIEWLLPNYEISRNGKIIKLDPDDEDSNGRMQFMTSSLDGTILVWDLKKFTHGMLLLPKVKKSQRTKDRPESLTKDISEFSKLNNILVPQFKFIIENPRTKFKHPITHMIIDNNNFCYKPINPETLTDYFTRTFFEPVKSEKEYEFTPNLILSTQLGGFVTANWEGHDYDQGQRINTVSCNIKEFLTVHDGPIRICCQNSYDPKVLLTVGGTIFAIWSVDLDEGPVFWRKNSARYVGGTWSANQPMSFVICRSDAHFETWEYKTYTKYPGRIIRFTGNPLMDMYSDPVKLHVKKHTFALTDIVGAVRIYRIPTVTQFSEESLKQLALIKKRLIRKKTMIKTLIKLLSTKNVQQAQDKKDSEKELDYDEDYEKNVDKEREYLSRRSTIMKRDPSTLDKVTSNLWEEKQEKFMYEVLLEKKKLNLSEIEQHRKPLQEMMRTKAIRERKLEKILANKSKIFETAKRTLFQQTIMKQRNKIQIVFPKEVECAMTKAYVDLYTENEISVLATIKSKQFRYIFDWTQMISDGKSRRYSINVASHNVNFHKLRHLNKKRDQEIIEIRESRFDPETISKAVLVSDTSPSNE